MENIKTKLNNMEYYTQVYFLFWILSLSQIIILAITNGITNIVFYVSIVLQTFSNLFIKKILSKFKELFEINEDNIQEVKILKK